MKISYDWLKEYINNKDLPSVKDIEERVSFDAFEVEDVQKVGEDTVFDIDVLPNRATDSLSHIGFARELATLYNFQIKDDPFPVKIDDILSQDLPISDAISISIEDTLYNPFHYLVRIKGVKVGPSPQWLQERLESIGQKSINNVVDATNYIMFALGQPSHVFDAGKLTQKDGQVGIVVRHATEGEKVKLLGGDEVELNKDICVLADMHDATKRALDVAGVKGGTPAELDESTTDVVITCAKFNPTMVRKAAQHIHIRTDAVQRYENDTPDILARVAVQKVTSLIQELAGGELLGYAVFEGQVRKNPEVTCNLRDFEKHTGLKLDMNKAKDILRRLHMDFTCDDDTCKIVAPWWRDDITIPEEVYEELARVYGYRNIEAQPLPPAHTKADVLPNFATISHIRKVLVEEGYFELYLYSLVDSGSLKMANALNANKDYLRENLHNGIIETFDKNERNAPLVGEYDLVRVFEFGKIFKPDSEEWSFCVGVRAIGGKKKSARSYKELMRIRNVLQDKLGVTLPEPKIGNEYIEVPLGDIMNDDTSSSYAFTKPVRSGVKYKPLITYPFIVRDIAAWSTNEGSEQQMRKIISEHGGELVKRIDKFDEFEKDGKTSIALHIVFQSDQKTLTDEEVGEIMSKIEENYKKEGFEVR